MALDPLTAVTDLATSVIGKIWPDKTEVEKAKMAFDMQLIQGQLGITAIEAANPNMFVSGWRPFIGWVCGSACAWNWIGLSIVSTVCTILNHPVVLVKADVSEMMPVLLGLLGLGAYRTYEKVKGVA